jgi:hypothetical protein
MVLMMAVTEMVVALVDGAYDGGDGDGGEMGGAEPRMDLPSERPRCRPLLTCSPHHGTYTARGLFVNEFY